MTNWKRVRYRRPSGWRINAEYSLVCCDAQHHRRAGHRDHPRTVDGNSRYRRAGLLTSAHNPSPEWGAMLGDALELIYVAPGLSCCGAAIMISVLLVNLLGDGVRRAYCGVE